MSLPSVPASACVPDAPRAQLRFNLSAPLDSGRIIILMRGESKLRAHLTASGPGPVEEIPVRVVLRQQRTPV